MWEEYIAPERENRGYRPDIRLSEPLWHDSLVKMVAVGMNMVVIDLGDAVKYTCHPEIAVRGAWEPERLRKELDKMRKMGLEPIPKLNFSAGHDTWLGPYSRMVSTNKYYAVCKALIEEVIDLFDQPRFFHIGMDEETVEHQRFCKHIVVRKNDLWWNDFLFLVKEVEKGGARAWIWSDFVWRHPKDFFERMPKSVVQSNWYYGDGFTLKDLAEPFYTCVKAYEDLEAYGYEQIPSGSNFNHDVNILRTVEFSKSTIDDARLLGFLQTLWLPTVEPSRTAILKGIELTGQAKANFK